MSDIEAQIVREAMQRVPTVARLYYGGLAPRRYLRASTNPKHHGEPLVHRSHMEREIRRAVIEALSAKGQP